MNSLSSALSLLDSEFINSSLCDCESQNSTQSVEFSELEPLLER